MLCGLEGDKYKVASLREDVMAAPGLKGLPFFFTVHLGFRARVGKPLSVGIKKKNAISCVRNHPAVIVVHFLLLVS